MSYITHVTKKVLFRITHLTRDLFSRHILITFFALFMATIITFSPRPCNTEMYILFQQFTIKTRNIYYMEKDSKKLIVPLFVVVCAVDVDSIGPISLLHSSPSQTHSATCITFPSIPKSCCLHPQVTTLAYLQSLLHMDSSPST